MNEVGFYKHKMKKRFIRKISINNFKVYPTFLGDTYRAMRLKDREIALEYHLASKQIRICLCLPYNELEDKKSGVIGRGANQVLREWIARNEKEAIEIINKKCLTTVRLDKLALDKEIQ